MELQGGRKRLALIAAIAVAALGIAATVAVLLVNRHTGESTAAVAGHASAASGSTMSPTATPQPSDVFVQVPGGPVPAGAVAVVRQLVSGTPTQQRAALSAAAAAALPASSGPIYPPGESLTLDADSWRSDTGFANATGVLVDSTGVSQHVEVGFIADPGHAGGWLVVSEGPIQ